MDAKKRRLMQASIAMPIIATLPSGAAMANASSSQCLVANEKQTELAGETITVRKDADSFLRMLVPEGVLRMRGDKHFKINPVYKIEKEYFDKHGTKYTGIDLRFKKKGHAFVVVVFNPSDDYSKVSVEGVWPESQLIDGNVALTGSCWTSLSPTAEVDFV